MKLEDGDSDLLMSGLYFRTKRGWTGPGNLMVDREDLVEELETIYKNRKDDGTTEKIRAQIL